MVYKRGKKYYYEFELYGKRYKKSTRCKNERDAQTIEANARLEVINAKAGIKTAKAPAPTLIAYSKTFLEWVNTDRDSAATRQFYQGCMSRILQCPGMAEKSLEEIDEPVVEAFKTWALQQTTRTGKTLSKARVNRLLETLKKALRYARDMLRLIDRVPIIKMFQGERSRDYVFTEEDFKVWIAACPEPLKSASLLARYTGICLGEMVALQKDSIKLLAEPSAGGFYGSMVIRHGLKRDCRKRTIKLSREMRDVLCKLSRTSECNYVFSSTRDPREPLNKACLSHQMRLMKKRGAFHKDAGLHTLRHTFLTEMGRLTDAFTLQKIAGHNCITTTMRYVHPQEDAIDSAFSKLNGSRAQTAEIVISEADVERLVDGQSISFSIPGNVKEVRLKSTQKPTLDSSMPNAVAATA